MTLLLLFACVTKESFPNQIAAVGCARYQECEKTAFEEQWSDMGECTEESRDYYDALAACYEDNCKFDGQAAAELLGEMRAADCDDLDEAVGQSGDVYTECEDETSIALCLLNVFI